MKAMPFNWLSVLFLSLTSILKFTIGVDNDLFLAPPSFMYQQKKIIPINFLNVELDLTFDVPAKTSKAKARIEFFANEAGFPFFDLVPNVTAIRLDGTNLGNTKLLTISSPNQTTKLRMLDTSVEASSKHILEIEYDLDASTYTFTGDGISTVWSMSDVGEDRKFLEQYAPSNLEFDRFTMDMTVLIKGATAKQSLFTNGRVEELGKYHWKIFFPEYFTTSSFYFHLTRNNFQILQEDYKGIASTYPLTVYSNSSSLTLQGLSRAKTILKELEMTYGPFAHERVVIYLQSSGGGMEHCGATITSLGALDHELTHSWFARGVMPADGNSGWIDEAIASWRDNGYPRASGLANRSAVNLAAFSSYRRSTPSTAYTAGAQFMSELDYVFPHGLKKVLSEVFEKRKHTVVTTPIFESILKNISGTDVARQFKRYVYNQNVKVAEVIDFGLLPFKTIPSFITRHPRPLTQKEIIELR